MSTTWRGTFTFNKYSQIAARALRQSLKETERVAAEKRGSTILRYQQWKDGQGGQQVHLNPPVEKKGPAPGAPTV
ncbi:mitochondrial ATP synthase epsilon chain-domain-containing protein [Irpex lacteus]|nr:mitochondrial ATP synthase epsilon chain-domain-containing protein [Irpex lacteus]